MKEAAGEKKQDTSPESAGEDLMDQIMSVHLARMEEITAKIPVDKPIGAADITALRDELKAYIAVTMASLSSMMATAVTSMAAPMLKDAVDKMCASDSADDAAEEEAERAQLQAIIDEGVSRMQALTARVTDMIAEDRKQDIAERKAILKALAELSKPRKRTGTVMLPSGKVEMTVVEAVQ